METTLSAFEYDEIPLYLNKKDFLTFENKELLFRYFENELYSEAANELSFLKMIVLKNKKPLLQVLPEDYTGIGGPAPYHDSITFTCLCENINEEFLLKKLKEKALIPDKVIYGKEFPQLNLIQKLKCCTPLLRWAVRFRQLILKKAMKKR
ncbi:hypothetical protein [Niabella hirudinis]|uniref:hypothetical protein n=1 Tax=Niabella hirudinis TaxID=1285929 RepID=UPI003EB6CC84